MKDMTNENEFKTPTLGEYLKGEEPAKEPETENNHISKEMDTNNAPEEQTRDAASKSGEPVNEQPPAENPAPSAGSDPTKSAAHAGDGTINITTESETGMVFPRAIPQDAMAVLDELERERALQSLICIILIRTVPHIIHLCSQSYRLRLQFHILSACRILFSPLHKAPEEDPSFSASRETAYPCRGLLPRPHGRPC